MENPLRLGDPGLRCVFGSGGGRGSRIHCQQHRRPSRPERRVGRLQNGRRDLRAAIEESNATPFFENEGNIIKFQFATFDGELAGTVELGSTLPTITRKVRIEGSPRPDQCETDYFGVPGPCTGIDGPAGGTAFRVSAPSVQLIGFAISNAKTAA
jgi:hypothetical protein